MASSRCQRGVRGSVIIAGLDQTDDTTVGVLIASER